MRPVWIPAFVHGRPEALAPCVRLCCADWLAGWHRDNGDPRPALEVTSYGQRKEGGLEGGLGDVGDGTDEEVENREIVGCSCGGGGDNGEHRRGEEGGFHQTAEMLEGSKVRERYAKV